MDAPIRIIRLRETWSAACSDANGVRSTAAMAVVCRALAANLLANEHVTMCDPVGMKVEQMMTRQLLVNCSDYVHNAAPHRPINMKGMYAQKSHD
jgi:hypothetical protein